MLELFSDAPIGSIVRYLKPSSTPTISTHMNSDCERRLPGATRCVRTEDLFVPVDSNIRHTLQHIHLRCSHFLVDAQHLGYLIFSDRHHFVESFGAILTYHEWFTLSSVDLYNILFKITSAPRQNEAIIGNRKPP